MDDLRQKLDKFIADLLKTTSRSTVVQVAAIYLLVTAFFGFCGGVLAIVGGGLAGFVGVAGIGASGVDTTGELAAASASLGAMAVLLVIIGVINIITAPISLAVAIGLFQRKPWSRMGTVILAAISAVLALVGLLFGGDLYQLIWLVVGAFVAYVFYTDEGIRQELNAG